MKNKIFLRRASYPFKLLNTKKIEVLVEARTIPGQDEVRKDKNVHRTYSHFLAKRSVSLLMALATQEWICSSYKQDLQSL